MTLQRLAVTVTLLLLIGAQSAVRLNAISAGTPIPAVELAPDGDFEWLVRLEADDQTCSGSLIAAEWVLTAAHCSNARLAFIGDDTAGIEVVEVAMHPQFEEGHVEFDAALLRLAAPSPVRPVTRADSDRSVVEGQELVLAGWGRSDPRGASAAPPSSAAAIVDVVDSALIQTGASAVACSGDSGGPLLFAGRLVGVIVAADAECSVFTVSVRFSNIEEWVTSLAGPGPDTLPPTELHRELTVTAGEVFEIPIEFADAGTPMSVDYIIDFNPGSLEVVSCRVEATITCRFMASIGSSGERQLTYTVSDGQHTTNARWTIHVLAANQPPFAQDGSLSALPGVARAVILSAFDANGTPLSFAIVTPPAHGVLSNCVTGTCMYTANAGYAGPDRFEWTASDGHHTSNVAAMIIEVQPAQAPIVTPGSEYAVKNDPRRIVLEAFDPNGDRITYEVVTRPRHGTLTDCVENVCWYVADSGFLGTDSFTWRASDGVLSSALAIFTIEVLPNNPPYAEDAEFKAKVNTLQRFFLPAGDPENHPLTFTFLTMPRHGTLSCAESSCVYEARPGFAGTDSFTWRVSDGDLSSRIATATLRTYASSWRVTPFGLAGGAHALAVSIAGPDAEVLDARLTGSPEAAGTFTGAAGAIGLSRGVILGTGDVADAVGPNLAALASIDYGRPGDPDLPAPSADAVSLSFDLVPTTSTFTARYVFASEEYPGGAGLVDEAAAFMVNGQNCALVGGSPVGVSSINHGNDDLGVPPSNPELLIANDTAGAVDTEMNGITVVLTCTAAVIPGQRNRIKIVLADSVDGLGNSVLFVEGTGTSAVNTPPAMAPLADITGPAVSAAGSPMTFIASGDDAEDGTLAAECLPASGAVFPIGDTTVACTVTDQEGATATGAFTITITEPETPGDMSGDGFVREGAARYQFSFHARENDRGERAKLSLRINPESPKGKGKDRDDRFESRSVTFVAFSDDPDVRHRPRRPQIDTVLFSGIGEWNGKPGFRYELSAQDEAEAGRRHRESIRVTIWNAAGDVVASVAGEVGGGAIRSKRLKH